MKKENLKDIIEKAHMAGQADAGVDPGYSNAQAYYNDLCEEKTNRGFNIHYFEDVNGVECSIQKSSIATDDCIWLGANKIELKEFIANRKPFAWVDITEVDENTMEHHFSANTRMHLNRDQVEALLPLLKKFVDSGDIR